MAKDPAFLFYPGDWNLGTMHLTLLEKGCYIELLILQFAKGKFTEAQAKHMLNGSFDLAWPTLKEKFSTDGNYFWNERLKLEKEKRQKFSESRRINGLAKKLPTKEVKHMPKHMEDENENKIVLEELGSERVSIAANLVWKDGRWKENFCMGNNVTAEELPLWMAKFNASVCNDSIPDFGPSKYKKMFQGWVVAQKTKGTKVEVGSLTRKTDSAPLTVLKPS